MAVRLETEQLHRESALLCEFFVEDMDGQLREFGVNDVVVGKHIGRLMSTLGGRMGAYRPALLNQDQGKLEAAADRNISFADGGSAACVANRLQKLHDHLATIDNETLLAAEFGMPEGA